MKPPTGDSLISSRVISNSNASMPDTWSDAASDEMIDRYRLWIKPMKPQAVMSEIHEFGCLPEQKPVFADHVDASR
jgi:hypothetical protein